MEIQDNTEIKYKHYCDLCNIGANSNSVWLNHLNSKKHQRGGLKPKICNICNSTFYNHWNLKQHYILIHATIEEKNKCKYYCKYCNVVFLSELYYENHMKSKKHINTITCLEKTEELKINIEQKNKPITLEILESYNIV
jgi:hypothetical protein